MAARILSGGGPIVLIAVVLGTGCESRYPLAPSHAGFSVTSISPSIGPAGTRVTILGTGFAAGITVTFGGIAGDAVVAALNGLTATAPAHAEGYVDVVVTNPDGVKAGIPGGYTYGEPPGTSLALTGIVPDVVSTVGGAQVWLVGANFQPGATVTFGDATVAAPPPTAARTNVVVVVPPHAAGPVDVVITNPDGQTARRRLTYAPVWSFDFNGPWDGYAGGETPAFRFTIQGNTLVSLTCGAQPAFLPPATRVIDGAFSFSLPDGTSMSGHLVAASQAVGEISVPPCERMSWFAQRPD